MTTADAILAELVTRWRAGECVPLWDALCEASATGAPVEEWVCPSPGRWGLTVGGTHVAAVRDVLGIVDTPIAWHWTSGSLRGTVGTLAAAKLAARAAAVASLRGEA